MPAVANIEEMSTRLVVLVLAFLSVGSLSGRAASQPRGVVTTSDLAFRGTNQGGVVTIKTNYYVFGGTNHFQMRAAMIEARPWKRRLTYDAQTKWELKTNYRFRRDGDGFAVNAVAVKTEVVITLPWWIPGKPVPRELVERWSKCVDGLSRHEQGHLVLAQAAAVEVKKRLLALPACATLRELAATADRIVNETVDEFRERERKYDEVTRHGFTQGAIFPRTQHDP
jgi:predicted secreted Zn-dependent protease